MAEAGLGFSGKSPWDKEYSGELSIESHRIIGHD